MAIQFAFYKKLFNCPFTPRCWTGEEEVKKPSDAEKIGYAVANHEEAAPCWGYEARKKAREKKERKGGGE